MKVICTNGTTAWKCEKDVDGNPKKNNVDETGKFLERINDHIHALSETKYEIVNVSLKIKRRTKKKTQDLLLFSLGIKHGVISEAATISIPYLFHIRKK